MEANTLATILTPPDWFFFLRIYPVGMKIAADYFEKGLGNH
jgi:hypothetical protein